MGQRGFRRLILVVAILPWPVTAYAQEAAIGGTITDTTGGVMPGVTVTALHETTGNTFVTVTDELGAYRIAVRPGRYRITGKLQGFAELTRSGVELLVGQTAVVDFEMGLSGQTVEVTVSAAAPLIDVTSSVVSSNIVPRRMPPILITGSITLKLPLVNSVAKTVFDNKKATVIKIEKKISFLAINYIITKSAVSVDRFIHF